MTNSLPANTNFDDIQEGDLVESFGRGLGRVLSLWHNGIEVEYSRGANGRYTFEDIKKGLVKVYMDYKVFVCSGKGESYRESGAYTTQGLSYEDAAINFGKHWNKCSFFGGYGERWNFFEKREGNPSKHQYMKDERGNTILMVRS